MHHPPLETGLRAMDVICLPPEDRTALADLLALNPQVLRVISGHVHRAAFGVLGGCGVVTCPSTYLQAPLEIPGGELTLVADDAGLRRPRPARRAADVTHTDDRGVRARSPQGSRTGLGLQ